MTGGASTDLPGFSIITEAVMLRDFDVVATMRMTAMRALAIALDIAFMPWRWLP
jgi:hypothetical protein